MNDYEAFVRDVMRDHDSRPDPTRTLVHPRSLPMRARVGGEPKAARRWLLAAGAAAAVLVIVTATFALTNRRGGGDQPAAVSPTSGPTVHSLGIDPHVSWWLVKVSENVLDVLVGRGVCDATPEPHVTETESTVTVRFSARILFSGPCVGSLVTERASVVLKHPLGGRQLVGCEPNGGKSCVGSAIRR